MHNRERRQEDASHTAREATADTLERISIRLRRIAEETQRIMDGGGTGSAYNLQQTVRSIQVDVDRLKERYTPRKRSTSRG